MRKAPADDPERPEGGKMKGYKWTQRESDGEIVIVTAECNNAVYLDHERQNFIYDDKAFYTTDCIIEAIEDSCGNALESVLGKAYTKSVYSYSVGDHKQGEKLYFLDEKEALWNTATALTMELVKVLWKCDHKTG